MPEWMQHLLVVLLVTACAAYMLYGAFATLLGKRSRVGSCCAKGCPPKTETAKASTERVIFLPAELLTNSKSRR